MTEPHIKVFVPALDLYFSGNPTYVLQEIANLNWKRYESLAEFKHVYAKRMQENNGIYIDPKVSVMTFIKSLEAIGVLIVETQNSEVAK